MVAWMIVSAVFTSVAVSLARWAMLVKMVSVLLRLVIRVVKVAKHASMEHAVKPSTNVEQFDVIVKRIVRQCVRVWEPWMIDVGHFQIGVWRTVSRLMRLKTVLVRRLDVRSEDCESGLVCVEGMCKPDPSCGCDPEFVQPVCGKRDNRSKSFKNPCQLECEGYAFEHFGRCLDQPRCETVFDCDPMDRCMPASDTLIPGGLGRARPIPIVWNVAVFVYRGNGATHKINAVMESAACPMDVPEFACRSVRSDSLHVSLEKPVSVHYSMIYLQELGCVSINVTPSDSVHLDLNASVES